MPNKILRLYVSDSYAIDGSDIHLPKGYQYTEQEIIQHALGGVLEKMGKRLQMEAARHNSIPITGLRMEVNKVLLDLDVRIHLEGEEKDGATVSEQLPSA
jgi:hypothetical protein